MRFKRARAFAEDELHAVKNESWLGEGEEPLTREKFLASLSIEDIHVDECGGFSLSYNVDEFFWGHAIMVGGNLERGPTIADLVG